MIDHLIAELGEKLDLTAEELADIIWLTLIRQTGTVREEVPRKPPQDKSAEIETRTGTTPNLSSPSAPSTVPGSADTTGIAGLAPRRSRAVKTNTVLDRVPFKVPNPPSIREPLALVRSLRPLMRQVPSGQIAGLDEQATAQQIAETKVWQPIVQPALESWLELVLVVDESASMLIWQRTVLEFRRLLRSYGTFRDVQLWGLHCKGDQLEVRPGIGAEGMQQSPRKLDELVDPSGRRLILIMTDCVAEAWHRPALIQALKRWAQVSPVAIAQVLPEWLWVRSAIRGFESVTLTSLEPGLPNRQLSVDWSAVWQVQVKPQSSLCVPIVPLEPTAVLTWSQMVMGQGEATGYWLRSFRPETAEVLPGSALPQALWERFQVQSSPVAQRLISLVAASPVITLPVIRLIQETLLQRSEPMNVAEVLLGGLLEPIEPPTLGVNPDDVEYRFVDETIRELVLADTPVPDTVVVLSKYIERQFEMSLDEFVAELQVWSQSENAELVKQAEPFATVTAAVLKRKGGRYRDFVQHIERQYLAPTKNQTAFPPLQAVEFEVGFVDETLQLFEFEHATLKIERRGIRRQATVVIQREPGRAWQYLEPLSESISLEMVSIPAGRFLMGSPENEIDRFEYESPQHEVTVAEFFIGKYPVTQAQWRFVADLPDCTLNPDPSRFKGDDRPVEQVSWQDAVEFCDRLSRHTGKLYRLPSEAEWEYTCRAETTTPFHFGKTITTDLANYRGTDNKEYNWSGSYGDGSKGIYREETTSVGSFGLANSFGLYDMHGNVWEWCADHWHGNYENAPVDGSAWIDSDADENANRVLRGGSWYFNPRYCRSASRYVVAAGGRSYYDGFRVVCSMPRTL